MNSLDAVRRMVDHYPGGREAIATRLGISAETLRKQLAGAAGFKLGVTDACTIASMCAELSTEHASDYASAVAAHCGAQVSLLPRAGDAGGDLILRASVMVKETAEVMGVVATRFADGEISQNDLRAIEKEAGEALASIQAVMQGVRAAYQRGRPNAVAAQTNEQWVRDLEGSPAHA